MHLHLNSVDLDPIQLVLEVGVKLKHISITHFRRFGCFRKHACHATRKRLQGALQLILLQVGGLFDICI